MMERSIDELLNGEPEEAVETATEAVETPELEAAPADDRPRDEHGRFAPKQTGVEEPTAEQPQEPTEAVPPTADHLPREVYEPLKAVRNENRELKQQIEQLNRQFAQLQQAPAAQPQPPVDFWDDPQAFMASQLEQATSLAVQRIQQQQTMERINASEAKAKAAYTDYDDAFMAFQQAAQANPALIQQMTSASDPAEFAYKKGKTALELERVGSIDELIANERAKWEAQARAAVPAPTQHFPSTTATDGSVAARTGPAWSGPPTIGELLR